MSRASAPLFISCGVVILESSPFDVCAGPGVSSVCGRDGFSGVTGLARPANSLPITSPSSHSWNGSTILLLLRHYSADSHDLGGSSFAASWVVLRAIMRDAIKCQNPYVQIQGMIGDTTVLLTAMQSGLGLG
jgi:hypothetical protein